MRPKVVFEDEDLLVLEKPAGMVVNKAETTREGETVQEWAENYLKIRSTKHEILNKSKIINSNVQNNFEFRDSNFEFSHRAGIVHRLDKETSGLLLVAKTPEAFENLQRQFKERVVKKRYLALVHGKVEPQEGEIKAPVGRLPWNRERFGVLPGGREATTRYKVIRNLVIRNLEFTLLELSPETGRTHQIRIHLKYLGHSVVGDLFYAGRKTAREDRLWCPRLFLHAAFLGFYHPTSQEWLEFKSKLPEDLERIMDQGV